jgi:hypothetical protein
MRKIGKRQEESSSFFEGASQAAAPEKEPKKLFPIGVRRNGLTGQPAATGPNGQKFFASFFQKRRFLLSSLQGHPA